MANEAKSKTGRIWAWVLGVILFLFIAIATGWHFFKRDLANPKSKIAKPLLTEELKKMVNDASDGLYHIEYSKFNLNINSGTCLITNFRLIPDNAVFKKLAARHKAPANVFNIALDSLIINKFGFSETKSGRKLNVGSIIIYHPVISMINKRRLYIDSTAESSLLMKMAKDILKSVNIKNILLHDMTFTLINENEKVKKHTALKNLTVYLTQLTIDSLSHLANDKQSVKPNASFGLQINTCRISTPDSLYYIYLNGMNLSTQQGNMLINKIAITPRLSIPAFYKRVRYDKDRIHMVFNRMMINHIKIGEFLKTQQLHIGHISVANSWTEVYNSYLWPRRLPPLRRHGYSQERLQRLAFDISIDTMVMHNGYTSYKIATKKSGGIANFFLTNTENKFYNITNNTRAKNKNRFATAFMRTNIMGAAKLNVNFRFDLQSENGAMSYTILMGKLDGRALNPLSVPLALLQIQSADVNKMYMHVKMNERFARGNINMYYTKMKVSVLTKDAATDTLKKKKFLSFVTNILLPDNNPNKSGKLREGPINVTRDPRMSFLGFMYRSMLDGMTSLVSGLNQHKDKPGKNTIINIGRKFVKPQTTNEHP